MFVEERSDESQFEVIMMAEDSNGQSALEEAQQLMSQLDTGGGDDDEGVTFSIDSDDEDDEGIGPPKPTDSHPLLDSHEDNIQVQNGTAQQNPLSSTSSQPYQASTSFASAATAVHSNQTGGMPTTAMGGQQPHHVVRSSLEQHSAGHPLAPGVVPATSSMASSSPNAAGGLLGDSWKQQTSRFASAMANMAQRAAHQVVSATSTQPPPNNMMMNQHHVMGLQPPQQQPTPSSSAGSLASYGSNSAVITSATGSEVGPAGTNPSMMQSAAELDNEQKAALIRTHVGELLPGERVIMFVANLLHVSDSTGFSYTYSPTAAGTDPSSSAAVASSGAAIWCCAMTYYRLILFGTHPFSPPPRPVDWNPTCWPHRPVHLLQMPLAGMERVDRTVFAAPMTSAAGGGGGPATGGTASNTLSTTSLMGLHIVGKDNGRTLRFTTPSYADTVRAHEALQTYAFPGRRNLGYLFAFESKKDDVMKSIVTDPATGQKQVTLPPVAKQFDAMTEFARQFQRYKNNNCPWTVYQSVNAHYQLCGSYPSILAGPSSLNENSPDSVRVLQQSATFRSEQRLPVLTYASGRGGGSLWRCSQPKIGLQGNRSPADEWLMKQILDQAVQANTTEPPRSPPIPRQVLLQLTGSASLEQFAKDWLPSFTTGTSSGSLMVPCELKILDLRPRSSAMANRTGGYGYENTSNYPGSTLQFCGIGNIHAVRDAYQKISNTCMSAATQDLQWVSQVEDSKWLHHIRNILTASWEAVYWIHVFSLPVVLHCSHGWDRTSQVACVAQLMLDPYYRTIPGFACLVEKDFMAFGHPFHTRCAHGVGTGGAGNTSSVVSNTVNTASNMAKNDNFDEGQVSPVFLQFLDCVYQLVSLYPDAFEITTRYLLDLSDHVYSCRFGNFLCDTERERETVAGIRQRTHSIWDFLQARHAGRSSKSLTGGVLLMPLPTLLRNVSLWTDRHAKFGAKPTQRWTMPESVPSNIWTGAPDGRHDDDTPHFHPIPTLQEAQAETLARLAMSSTDSPSITIQNTGTPTASQPINPDTSVETSIKEETTK